MSKIKSIKAREILDSRGEPTVEAELETDLGIFRASVPSGASKGKYEAKELRDGGKRYCGKGVLKAVKNVDEIIGPRLEGKDPRKQKEIDELMIKIDGTENKSKLGANAILAVSIAVCRAGAAAKGISLYKHISEIENCKLKIENWRMPRPCFNIINGGAHAGSDLDIQEFMIIPQKRSFSGNLQTASETYHRLKKILKDKYNKQSINVGDEGGFVPPISHAREALELIKKASDNFSNLKIGLDCAASQFYKEGRYYLEKAVFTKKGLLSFYNDLVKNYPIIFIEDPFAQDDWQGFQDIVRQIAGRLDIVGDDLLTTNPKRIKEAKEKNACNALLLKPNQIGTVTEALKAAELAKSYGWKIMVSHRSGDTLDSFISDFAVGIGADFIKSGAPVRGERVAKYNRLLEIEKEIEG